MNTLKKIKDCVFCDRNKIKSEILLELNDCIVFEPLNPVVEGHVIIVPEEHVSDFADGAYWMSQIVFVAGEWARRTGGDYNLITSKGKSATQSVFHLHVHLVPRRERDGLLLPWTGQEVLKKSWQRGYKEGYEAGKIV